MKYNKIKENNILIVYKKSVYEIYNSSDNKELIKSIKKNKKEYNAMKKSHGIQNKTLEHVLNTLEYNGVKHKAIYRAELGKYKKELEDDNLKITIGGDGTVLEVSHYVKNAPILGVNSDPETSIGFYCDAKKETFLGIMINIQSTDITKLNRLALTINKKKIKEPVLNEIRFIHEQAGGTRFKLKTKGKTIKYQNPYAFIACTAAGSSGAMRGYGGELMLLNSNKIQYYAVGKRNDKYRFTNKLEMESLTRQGIIQIDGIHITYEFGIGSKLILKKGKPLYLVGDLETNRDVMINGIPKPERRN